MDCAHKNMVNPPPGRHLCICLDCAKRIVVCTTCSATTVASTDIVGSGWMKYGTQGNETVYACPGCWSEKMRS